MEVFLVYDILIDRLVVSICLLKLGTKTFCRGFKLPGVSVKNSKTVLEKLFHWKVISKRFEILKSLSMNPEVLHTLQIIGKCITILTKGEFFDIVIISAIKVRRMDGLIFLTIVWQKLN